MAVTAVCKTSTRTPCYSPKYADPIALMLSVFSSFHCKSNSSVYYHYIEWSRKNCTKFNAASFWNRLQ